jgi:SAM-dependent methyltransferase
VGRRDAAKMRDYWEERARLNPAYYVDTSLSYDNPDMERFLETGRRVATQALDGPPAVTPTGNALAVEIGCGMGRICLALSERFDRVVGYDISAEMLRRARELVPDERIDFRLTEGATLPGLAEGSADLVLTFTVFQHIPSLDIIRSYVDEAGRVLTSGGVFVLQWNGTPGAARWRLRRWVKAVEHRLGRGDRYGRDAPQFLGSRVELEDMRAMLAAADMTLEVTDGEGTLFTWGWARKN